MRTQIEYVLWGSHPAHCNGSPIKIVGGSYRKCRGEWRRRLGEGKWALEIVKQGERPWALDQIVSAAK